MKLILKTIAFGILLGTAAFIIPFLFKFLMIVLIISLMLKLVFSNKRNRHFADRFESYKRYYMPVVPIDNQWYKPAIQKDVPVNQIKINYNESI